jgi:hypothetical protein
MSDVYLLDEPEPFGLTYGEWAAKWWQWLLTVPRENSPGWDKTGKNCDQNQTDPNVWFLTGENENLAERTCTIPADKAILLSVASCECSYAEFPDLTTESELRNYAKSGNNVSSIEVSIDGVKVEDLEKYHVQSPLFDVTLPDNNVLDPPPGQTQAVCAPPGQTQAVCDAYMLFLKPLPPGDHELHFRQVTEDDKLSRTSKCRYDVTYNLKIE